MTQACFLTDLDDILAAEGYQWEAPTSVQLRDLGATADAAGSGVILDEEPTDAWLAAHCRMSGIQEGQNAAHEYILRSIKPRTGCASMVANGQIMACGLGVLENGLDRLLRHYC